MRCRQAATKCPGLGRNRPRRNGHAQFAPDGPGASAQDRHRGGTSGNPGGSQSEHGRPGAARLPHSGMAETEDRYRLKLK